MSTAGPTGAGLDAAAVREIEGLLDRIQSRDRVSIPLAIESGSRAWGFPSPDSDYDCRFIFVRSMDDYLSPWPKRDVIEASVGRLLDVSGWDLAKALKLLLKGNAVVIEWLTSPIAYRLDEQFRAEFLDLARAVTDRVLVARHYLHLGERQRKTYFADESAVPGKKVFYALRPAAALRWLRLHPEAAVAPMHFPALMAECEPPDDIVRTVADLIDRKAASRELATEPLAPPLGAFIDREFALARETLDRRPSPLTTDRKGKAEAFFRQTVRRLDRH